MLVFSFVFVFEGCSSTETGSDTAPCVDIPGTTPHAGTPDLSKPPNGPYDSTTMAAQPIIGIYLFHPNFLDSISLMTDYNVDPAQVQVVSEVHYKQYEEKVIMASYGPDMFRHKYTAQEEDPKTSLMYYGARYYDPGIGRFITADTVVPVSNSTFLMRFVWENYSNNNNKINKYNVKKIITMQYDRYLYIKGNPIKSKKISCQTNQAQLFAGIIGAILAAVTFMVLSAIFLPTGLHSTITRFISVTGLSIATILYLWIINNN